MKTRPDLSVTARMLAFCEEGFKQIHISATKHGLQYLKGSADELLMMLTGNDDQHTAFFVACYGANNKKNRKSRSGVFILFENTFLYATINLQKSISLGSMEAKYVALSDATKTITSFWQTFIELCD